MTCHSVIPDYNCTGRMATNRFVPGKFSVLPWLVGIGGMLLYLLTLNPWISLNSLGTVARTAGWTWQPEQTRPLTWIFLLPFRCLPETWIPLSLNFAGVVCAALVLVLLARSVG